MIEANDYFLSHAIESLVNHRYFQVGKESVAIGLVCDLPENVEKETEIYEKYLH